MKNEMLEDLANEFFNLLPLFKRIIKPLEKSAKTLSPMQFHALFFLNGLDPISMSELAAKMNISRQHLTPLIDKLEEHGFIERIHDKNDRRSVKISLTPPGSNYLAQHRKETLALIAGRFERLSVEEINELHTAIQTFGKILNK